jgi:lipopolysaccharide cholinephosphotransferase
MEEDFSKYNGEGTDLRKAQLRMLDILIAVDKICRKHNIPYWLDYGTLLGAVRHGGFIPWDDDVDISMMKDDYNRFLAIAPKELPEQFAIQNTNTEKYHYVPFTKVIDKYSKVTVISKNQLQQKRKYQGLWIDIFPVIKGDVRYLNLVEPLYVRCFHRIHHFEPFNFKVLVAYMLYPFVWVAKQIICLQGLLGDKEKIMEDFGVPETAPARQKFYSDYFPTREIQFEGVSFPAPNHTDKVLTKEYGDYMQVPPEDKRIIHHAEITYLK